MHQHPDAWADWCELLDCLEYGERIPPRIRAWFLVAARGWSEAVGDEPLHAFLGIERRRRLDYLRGRLAELFREAAAAVAPTGTPWRRAGIIEKELDRYERRTWSQHRGQPISPAWSRRDQAFARLLALPIAAPRKQRSIAELLQASPLCLAVGAVLTSGPVTTEAPAMKQTDSIEERARREFETSAAIRHEFCGDLAAYVAYCRAEASGSIKRIQGSRDA